MYSSPGSRNANAFPKKPSLFFSYSPALGRTMPYALSISTSSSFEIFLFLNSSSASATAAGARLSLSRVIMSSNSLFVRSASISQLQVPPDGGQRNLMIFDRFHLTQLGDYFFNIPLNGIIRLQEAHVFQNFLAP